MSIYSNSLSAFGAFGSLMDVVSHNIANISTDGYKSLSVNFESGPGDQGVQISRLRRDYSSGPAVINDVSYSRDISFAMNARPAQLNDQVNAKSIITQDHAVKNEFGEYPATWDKAASREYAEVYFDRYRDPSNVDLPREFLNLTIAETAYSANAAVVRTLDEMTGSLLNVVT